MTPRTIKDFEALTGDEALTPAERRLIAACRAGEPCVLGDERPTAATVENRVRASLLKVLITGGTADCGLHESGVWLDGGWIAGQLNLSFARSTGHTLLRNCHFGETPWMVQSELELLNLDGSCLPGLRAQGAKVTAAMFLRHIAASGTIDVNGTEISGQLGCDGASFQVKGGRALNAQWLKVGGSIVLNTARIYGAVDLVEAEIGGQFDCTGALIDHFGGRALNAQGTIVRADLILRSVTVRGTVALNGAEIGGQMNCEGASFDGRAGLALGAQRLRVAEGLFWRGLRDVSGIVYLNGARVGDLVDDVVSWPKAPDQLNLDGFTYDRIAGSTTSAEQRLCWLRAGSNFNGTFYPQPYTQLAKVLSAMGHERQARRVRIELERILARQERAERRIVPNGAVGVRLRSLWRDILNAGFGGLDVASRLIVGYGHRPIGALMALAGLWVAAWALAWAVWTEGSFAPNSDVVLVSSDWQAMMAMDCIGPLASPPPADYDGPCLANPADYWSGAGQPGMDWDSFKAWSYGLDLVVPVLDLGQTDAWAPSKDRGFWGWSLWWGRWVLQVGGWIVTALGAAAITGIMQRARE